MILRLKLSYIVILVISMNSTICLKLNHNTHDVLYNSGLSGSNRQQHSRDDGIICNNMERERFLDFGVQSSFSFLLNPGTTVNSCQRFFIPSELSSVLVRLTKLNDDRTSNDSHNASSICPITIENAGNSPWMVDPCSDKGVQEYWRIFEGNLNIFWQHQSNHLPFVVTLSKVKYGEACVSESLHICPKFGSNLLVFCIASHLVCDGLRQCPNGNEMTDDENMCGMRGSPHQSNHQPTKTKRQLPGSLKFILLGALICLVALSIFSIWEFARRSYDNDEVAINGPSRNQHQDDTISIKNDAPPAYSTLFPCEKVELTDVKNKTESQPTIFLPSAPEIEPTAMDQIDFEGIERKITGELGHCFNKNA